MSESNVAALVPTKSDVELAADLRKELAAVLEHACEILNRGRATGLAISWNLGPDQYGRNRVLDIMVARPL